ncbi:MAG: hypothetical protein RI907_669 [Pseudomonadota bacterium]
MIKGIERLGRWQKGRTALGLAALLAVAACGGGGGSSSSAGGSDGGGGTNTVTASGVASKGLLANADVKAYAVNADGTPDRSSVLGSTTTDASGRYTLTGLPAGTPVILEVTPKASGTTMYDEATGTAVAIDSSAEFSLSAAVVLDSTGTTSAQITPYTTMAVELAKTEKAADSTKSIADVITAANTSVSTALNVPILSAEPTFTGEGANKKPSNEAAVKLAAVSKLAQDDETCGALSTTVAKVKCAVEKLKDDAKRERDSEDRSVLTSTLVSQLNLAQSRVEKDPNATISVTAVTSGTVTQPVSKSDQGTAVAAAKAMVRNLRSSLNTMTDKSDATSLVARAKVVGDAFDASHSPFNQSGVIGLARVLDMMTRGNVNEYKYGSLFQPSSTLDGAVLAVPGAIGGGCSVFPNSQFGTASEDDYTVDKTYVACRITYKVTLGQELESGYYSATAVQMIYRVVRDATGVAQGEQDQFTVKTVLVNQAGTWTQEGGFSRTSGVAAIDKVSGAAVNSSFTGWQTVVAKRTVKQAGATEEDFALYGDISLVGNLAPSLSQWAWGQLPGKVNVGSTAVDAAMAQVNGTAEGTTRATLKGLFTLLGTDGSTKLSSFKLQEGSYVEAVTADQGYVHAPTSSQAKVHLAFEATAWSGAVIAGELNATDFIDINDTTNAAVPTNAVFSGSIRESAQASVPLFTGSLTAALSQASEPAPSPAPGPGAGPGAPIGPSVSPSAVLIEVSPVTSLDDYPVRTFVLDGTLVMAGSTTMHVGLTLTLDLNGEGTLRGTLTVSGEGGASLALDVTIDREVTAASHFKLEDLTSGVKLDVSGTDDGAPQTSSLYKGTTVVGLVDFDKAKVTYVDNTYEQF